MGAGGGRDGGLGEDPAPARLAFASSPLCRLRVGTGWQESAFTARQVAAFRRKPGKVPPRSRRATCSSHRVRGQRSATSTQVTAGP